MNITAVALLFMGLAAGCIADGLASFTFRVTGTNSTSFSGKVTVAVVPSDTPVASGSASLKTDSRMVRLLTTDG